MIRRVRSRFPAISLAAIFVTAPFGMQTAFPQGARPEVQIGSHIVEINTRTAMVSLFDSSQPLPSMWQALQLPPVPGFVLGSTVSYAPGREPHLYVNPANGQLQWVIYGSQPPSGWIKVMPLTLPAPTLPHSLMPSAAPSATAPATSPPAAAPAAPAQVQTTKQPSADYGAGGHSELDSDATGSVVESRVYDPSNNLRDDTTYQYATSNGKQYRTGSYEWDFDLKGHLSFTLGLRYDFHGDLAFSDYTTYGLHGERSSEEVAEYRADGNEIREWSVSTRNWAYTFNSYKLPSISSPATTPQTPVAPSNLSLGTILPGDYHLGGFFSGSFWRSAYADNFKVVPGLRVYDLSLQSYLLPDGTPEWVRFRIGFPGYGYWPLHANGTFSLRIPLDWKGPLSLRVMQIDSVSSLGSGSADFQLGDAVAAPTLPGNYFSTQAQSRISFWTFLHLMDLWDDADDLEDELDYEYSLANPDWDYIDYLEDELDYDYWSIDAIEWGFPPNCLATYLHNLNLEVVGYNTWLGGQSNLTADQQTELKSSTRWLNFLSNEIDIANFLSAWNSPSVVQPFWLNPVLNTTKVNAARGMFPGDPLDTTILAGGSPVTFIAATNTVSYFMPSPSLAAGPTNETIDSPLFPETVVPAYDMTLDMGAGQLKLSKGMSTNYFARLNFFKSPDSLFANLFNGPPLYETDIIGSSELSAIQKAAPSPDEGFATLSVTDESPAVISMQDQVRVATAPDILPTGSLEIDGSLTAKLDGTFSLLGVGRANFAPVGGIGTPPAALTPSVGYSIDNWIPSLSISYDPSTLAKSAFMTDCSAAAAVPGTTTPGATTPMATTATTISATSTAATAASAATSTTTSVVSTSSDCPSAALLDLYDDATNGPSTSTPVGNPPDTSELDAAIQHVAEARTRLSKAQSQLDTAQQALSAAWDSGLTDLPASTLQAVNDQTTKLADILAYTLKSSRDLKSEYEKNRTQENLTALNTAIANLDSAWAESDRYTQHVINNLFSPADRAAYKAAVQALDKAKEELDNASAVLRSAEGDLERAAQSATTK